MQATNEQASLRSGRLRRFFLFYLLAILATCQVIFGLLLLGVELSPRVIVVVVPFVAPLSIAAITLALGSERAALEEPALWWRWALIGLAMFGIWAGSYFLVGRLVDPSRVRYLPALLEARMPLRPEFSLIYILLYPSFLLPFFVVRDRAVLMRLVTADLLVFAVCSVVFLAFPVAYPRPELPAGSQGLGVWVLTLVQGSDPAWNCLPSEHCAVALLAALVMWESDGRVGVYGLVTALLIGVSTLYTKQHYLVDVLSGYAISLSIYLALRSRVLCRGC
jgi:membrane-associated phospholipid phosphatase